MAFLYKTVQVYHDLSSVPRPFGNIFSRVRRKSGWNNNPTALQFKWTLRMLLLKNSVLSSKHAKCIELECSNNLFSKESEEEENIYDPTLPPHLSQFVKLMQSPSIYHKHVLHYVSEYMCTKLASLSNATYAARFF